MKNKQSTSKTSIKMAALLLDNFYPKEEILAKLNIKTPTFFKNMHLLKISGIKFEKENKKYKISAFADTINYSSLNTSIMAHLLTLSSNFFPKNKTQSLMLIFKKFLYLSSLENFNQFLKKYNFFKKVSSNNEYKDKIELLQKYIDEKTILKVKTKDLNEFALKPLGFISKQDETFFIFESLEHKEKKEIKAQDIKEMGPDKKLSQTNKNHETIFELTGRMARTYLLKEEEILIDTSKDKIVVSNYSENKEKLFKRLLRYDVLCNIRFPKQDRIDFENLLKKSLDNIDKFQDNIDK